MWVLRRGREGGREREGGKEGGREREGGREEERKVLHVATCK